MEVVLVCVGPSIDIVGFDIDLEWPVVVVDLVAVLVELGHLHNRHSPDVVSNFGQVLANAVSCAVVVHLSQDIGPTVPEEVEGGLSVKGEHCEPVTRVHTITEAFDSVTRGGLGILWGGLGELRDSHDSVFEALEAAGVWGVGSRDELHRRDNASWVSSLYPVEGYGVGDDVKGVVHVLLEKETKLGSDEESLRICLKDDVVPDCLPLAVSAQDVVCRSVEVII
jgi:hypothetical protein